MSGKDRTSLKRRRYLKTLGAMAVGTTAVPTTTSAKQSDSKTTQKIRKRFEKGLKKRKKKNWSSERWFEYVEKQGIRFGNKQIEREVPRLGPDREEQDGVSTQVISPMEPADLTLTFTHYILGPPASPNIPGYDAIEMSWEFDNSGVDDNNTGKPKDIVKIGIDPDHYTKPTELDGSDWYDFGNTTELAGPDAVGDGGLVGKYDGYYFKFQNPLFGDGESGGDLDYSDYMTLYVDPNLSLSSAERRIHFSYSMLYDSATYGGTSVGSDGVMSVGITNEEDSWTVAASYEEEDIRGGKEYSE